jgi:diketogulonate reductase-like aldo/keto reductase
MGLCNLDFKKLGKSDVDIPVLGLGTWGIGGFMSKHSGGEANEVRALKLGLELGMRFIDTAEIYARGHSEEVVAETVQQDRENVFIATKVSAENLSFDGVIRSCESSLRRLRTSYVDLYQVHWPNTRIPIQETMRAMEKLMAEGKIRNIGVSNFSKKQTRETQEALSKTSLASNQVEYSLVERSIEKELLPYCTSEHVTVIAYTPLGRGRFLEDRRDRGGRVLDEIASKYRKTKAQIALNWLIVKEPVVAIPKASNLEHVRENAGAAGWKLSMEDQERLGEAFS